MRDAGLDDTGDNLPAVGRAADYGEARNGFVADKLREWSGAFREPFHVLGRDAGFGENRQVRLARK